MNLLWRLPAKPLELAFLINSRSSGIPTLKLPPQAAPSARCALKKVPNARERHRPPPLEQIVASLQPRVQFWNRCPQKGIAAIGREHLWSRVGATGGNPRRFRSDGKEHVCHPSGTPAESARQFIVALDAPRLPCAGGDRVITRSRCVRGDRRRKPRRLRCSAARPKNRREPYRRWQQRSMSNLNSTPRTQRPPRVSTRFSPAARPASGILRDARGGSYAPRGPATG